MTRLVPVSDASRKAAADLLDQISDILQHNGIGQVADLIRDGEYDEHEASQAFAQARLAALDEAANSIGRLVQTYRESGVDGCFAWIAPLKDACDTILALKETPDAK